MILTPIIHAKFGYTPAFMICGLGLIIGLIYFATKLPEFKSMGSPADFKPLTMSTIIPVAMVILSLTLFAGFLLSNLLYAKILIFSTVVFVVSMFAYFYYTLPSVEGNKVLAILILLFLTAIFFSMQLQMFGVLNIFIDKHVDRTFFGYVIPAGNYAALNGFWVAVLGPVIAKFYIHMESKKKVMSIASRFASGILIASSAFYLLSTSHWFVSTGTVSSMWIVVSYFIISFGEILVSALGLALICKLAPPKLTTLFMGSFLLALAIGGWVSGIIGHWIVIPEGVTHMQTMLIAYNHAFLNVGHMSLITGIIAVLLIPYISRLTGERTK